MLGKWSGEASGVIQITGNTGNGAYSQSISVSDAISGENNAVGYLWARKRVERLTDYGRNAENPDVKAEVTQIGLSYNMVTPYTSFIAVIDTVRNPDGNGTDVNQPLSLPLEVSNLAVGYRIGSEPGETVLILLLAMFMLRTALMKRIRQKIRASCIPEH